MILNLLSMDNKNAKYADLLFIDNKTTKNTILLFIDNKKKQRFVDFCCFEQQRFVDFCKDANLCSSKPTCGKLEKNF